MEFEITSQGNLFLVSIRGEVDLFYAPKLRETILNHLKENKNVALELTNVSYIDSSGIASLVEGFQFAKAKGLRYGLIGCSTAVLQVLQLARLDKVLPVYDRFDTFTSTL